MLVTKTLMETVNMISLFLLNDVLEDSVGKLLVGAGFLLFL